MNKKRLACWAMSLDGLNLAGRLARHIAEGATGYTDAEIFAPKRLCTRWPDRGAHALPDIGQGMAERFHAFGGHIIIGAAGLAVRLIAPLIRDKRSDPAVLVVDSQGLFVISLLSGHLGGANDLTRQIAAVLKALPVITTASDQKDAPALDILFRDAGLIPLDTDELAPMQALFLENTPPAIHDPLHLLQSLPQRKTEDPEYTPGICLDWKKHAKKTGRLRVLIPCVLGTGCRKGTAPELVARAIALFLAEHAVEEKAIRALASVSSKAGEPGLAAWALAHGIPFHTVDPATLSRIKTPTPSAAAGRLFGTRPFSVCEAAALAVCSRLLVRDGGYPALVLTKRRYFHAVTLALGCPAANMKDP